MTLYEEQGRKGRLLQSLKTLLPHTTFKGSMIAGRWRTLESLLTLILAYLRETASRRAGRDIRKVVLGRPARFSTVDKEERLAEERLRLAAAAAGFDEIRLVLEPVAAAADYQKSISRPEIALIADLGAGTSDFTVARLDPAAASLDRLQVLASSGVRLGGDNVDGLVMWHKLTRYLGRGTKWNSGQEWLDVPVRIFRDLCQWEQLSFLRTSRTRDDLDTFIRRAADPAGLRRLAILIDRDLGYGVFRAIESSKIGLAAGSSPITFNDEGLAIDQELTLGEMREWLADFEAKTLACVTEALRSAAVASDAIETVFMTGGTSLLAPVADLFARTFGAGKLRPGDPFNSVAQGLLELAPD
jgi:hypothetical chaperone protein